MQNVIRIEAEAQRVVARLLCEIDHHTAAVLRARIDERLFESKPRELVLDFSGVRFMDSSGIGLILGRLELMRTLRGTLILSGLSPTLTKLVRLCGIEKQKDIYIR